MKWEEPELISIDRVNQTSGRCQPTGSADASSCLAGGVAGETCQNGGAAGTCSPVGTVGVG
jgi:hypothetical protein